MSGSQAARLPNRASTTGREGALHKVLTLTRLQQVWFSKEGTMTIAEVSKEYGMPEDTLRYYERIGLLPPVHRKKGGIRDYQEEDCRWVEFVHCMRNAGLSIEVLIEYLRLFQLGDSTIAARQGLLIEQRELLRQKLDDMQKTLERLDYKIEYYGKMGKDAKSKR